MVLQLGEGITTMSNDDFIDAPPPLYKYDGDGHVHDDNQAVLRSQQNRRRALLGAKQRSNRH